MNGTALNSPAQCTLSCPARSAEDRRQERRRLHSLVRISYCSDLTRSAHIGRGVDIGDDGVSFEIGTALDFHRLLLLEYMEDGRNCRRTARLRYRINRTYGAYFVDIARDELPR